MRKLRAIPARPLFRRALLLVTIITISLLEAQSAEAKYPVRPTPGGLSPTPDITSMASTNNEVTVKWNGFGGPYQLEKLPNLGGQWQPVGNSTENKQITVPGSAHHEFFRVRAADPGYAGAEICAECHGTTANHWAKTGHAAAYDTLAAINQGENASCVKCHTVGAGLSTGFKDMTTTPFFAGVQCESCHGPAAAHANNPENPLTLPVISTSANLCGGCHEGDHHPTFTEWKSSVHSRVEPHVAEGMEAPSSSVGRMNSCGACHSGAVRAAMMKTVGGAELVLPSGHEAASTGIECSTCHSSHQSATTSASLRNPQFSTNYFALSSSASFASQYDPNVQLCGQCHNHRNAGPNDTARPPHHSPQYNVLIGDIGTADGKAPATIHSRHTTLSKQCSSCHVKRYEPEVVSAENPVYTGHDFAPSIKACSGCHQSEEHAEELVATLQLEIRTSIDEVKQLLDTWAETKSVEALRASYGKLAWEYNSVGQLSNPNGASMRGPTTSEQADVPAEVKKARFWLYMIEHDGSYGVHNPKFARSLLDEAKSTVTALLDAP